MSDSAHTEEALAGLAMGRIPPGDGALGKEVLAAARGHGMVCLINERLREQPSLSSSGDRERWWKAAAAEAAAAARRDLHLRGTLELLAEAGVFPLIVKGAALAHTHYASPGLRPRGDNDLWIPEAALANLDRVLRAAGYQTEVSIDGSLIRHQRSYFQTTGSRGFRHVYDVHWRISNRPAVVRSGLFDFEDCASRSVPVPALGRHGRTLADDDALLLACLHLFAHHAHDQRLIWLNDIHLLVEAMDESRFRRFAARAEASGFAPVCRDAIGKAGRYFATQAPLAAAWSDEAGKSGPLRGFGGESRIGRLGHDLRALPGWKDRVRFLLQHAWPSRDYMLRRYPIDRPWKLPYFYLRRLIAALGKLKDTPKAH